MASHAATLFQQPTPTRGPGRPSSARPMSRAWLPSPARLPVVAASCMRSPSQHQRVLGAGRAALGPGSLLARATAPPCVRSAPRGRRGLAVRASGEGGPGDGNFVENNPLGIELRSRLQATQLARKAEGNFDWIEVDGCFVRLPPGNPEGVIHFLGGAVLGEIAYDDMCARICNDGSYIVIATPYGLDLNHKEIADQSLKRFEKAFLGLQLKYGYSPALPVFGIGHSLGGKLQALISCETNAASLGGAAEGTRREGNVFVSFNNFAATDSVDLIDNICNELLEKTPEVAASPQLQMLFRGLPQLARVAAGWAETAGMEFIPTPEDTANLIKRKYDVPRTHIVKFDEDKIDQSGPLEGYLGAPANAGSWSRSDLPGNHLTPVFVKLDASKVGPLAEGLKGIGADTEFRLGDEEGVKKLGMEVVGFLKGFVGAAKVA